MAEEADLMEVFDAVLADDLKALQRFAKDLLNREYGQTALHVAAYTGDLAVVEWLVERGLHVDKKDYRLLTPLHRACRHDHDAVVESLLDYGCDPKPPDRRWMTPLHLCASNNALKSAGLLIRCLKDVNSTDQHGYSALHYAANFGHAEMVQLLLANSATVDARDHKGRQALHMAAYEGHMAVVDILLGAGAHVDATDSCLYNALHSASAGGHSEICRLLLDTGQVDVHCRTLHGNTPLHVAARSGRVNVIELLINAGADVNRCNDRLETPLHLAVIFAGGHAATEALIASGADVNAKASGGSTPLHFCAATGRRERAATLLSNGADPNAQDSSGNTPLHRAAEKGHDLVAKILVESGAAVGMKNKNGLCAMDVAAAHGFSSVVRMLLKMGIRADQVDNEGRSCLHHAASTCFPSDSCVKVLLSQQVNHRRADLQGRIPLHYAAHNGNVYILKALLAAGTDVNYGDYKNQTALHYGCLYDSAGELVKELVRNGADCLALDNYGFSPLHYAAMRGFASSCKIILSKISAADLVRLFDGSSCTPAHLAALNGHVDVLKLFIKNGCQMDKPDTAGCSPLYVALRNGRPGAAALLLKNGAACTRHTFADGTTPLHLAVAYRVSSGLLEDMIKKLPKKNHIDLQDKLKRTPLMFAATQNDGRAVELLLKSGADALLVDKNGRTALDVAVMHGNVKAVELILQYIGADRTIELMNRVDGSGQTLLHEAAWLGDERILKLLLKHLPSGAPPVEAMLTRNGHSPMHIAVVKGHRTALLRLLDLVGSKSAPSITSLMHLAAQHAASELYALLLRFFGKKSAHLEDELHRNALHCACSAGCADTVKVLLEAGCDVSKVDVNNSTPVMEACKRGSGAQTVPILDHILKAVPNLDLTAVDCDGNTALHHALIHNNTDAAIFLLNHLSDAELRNKADETPLHYALAHRMLPVVQALLCKGADPFSFDSQVQCCPLMALGDDDAQRDCMKLIALSSIARLKSDRPDDSKLAVALANVSSDSEFF